jgi:RNA polymerase sigma factor (sigma-70 family)
LTAIAFFELWRHRGKVRIVNDSVLPWLLVTASHSARNASRARKRYLNMLSRLPHDEDCVDTAEEEALRALPFDATTSPLAKALQNLPEVDEQLMRLVALEGLTTADAARLLGLRPEAARARLMRARRRLASLPEITSLVNAMPL